MILFYKPIKLGKNKYQTKISTRKEQKKKSKTTWKEFTFATYLTTLIPYEYGGSLLFSVARGTLRRSNWICD